ncbi:hypothetical protein EVAR_60962_1 [Eumeta japonica]|uniref:Uncharacterized protein n=1 Tax=Eumeta variegata TaxID=151549 RepID=A0A4C1XXK4_EUMVA|nr:hypothetical protein EVAR_60962_1 [Eumeta japonica]
MSPELRRPICMEGALSGAPARPLGAIGASDPSLLPYASSVKLFLSRSEEKTGQVHHTRKVRCIDADKTTKLCRRSGKATLAFFRGFVRKHQAYNEGYASKQRRLRGQWAQVITPLGMRVYPSQNYNIHACSYDHYSFQV